VSRYGYSPATRAEIERAVRDAIPGRLRLTQASLQEDYGGVDLHYTLNGSCPLQVRCRFDRPAYAPDVDVTFRSTEPPMIEARTYAPLMLFLWFRNGHYVAGKLIDVYRMAERADPPLDARPKRPNSDGTRWLAVGVGELHDARALLRQGDRDGWATACLGGAERLNRIVSAKDRAAS
jgi:hypothetical protein